MSEESLLSAVYNNLDFNSLLDLEQRVLALQCDYKQKQTDLMQHYQRTQQELAVRHFAESQTLLEEFLKERSAASGVHAPVIRHSSLPAMSSLSRTNSLEAANTSSSPVSHAATTISERTKEKLKAFIYSKRRRQLSSNDDTRQLFSPYLVKPTGSGLYQLRKVRSESDLDSRLAGMQSKLAESMVVSRDASSVSLASPSPLLLNGAKGGLPLPMGALPLYLSRSNDTLNRADGCNVLPCNNSFLTNSSQFLSTSSLNSAAVSPQLSGAAYGQSPLFPLGAAAAMYFGLPNDYLSTGAAGGGGGGLCLTSGVMPNAISGSSLFPPIEQYQYNVLRQQLRDLVLRRKSLVREETDDEVARERLGLQLPNSLASLGLTENTISAGGRSTGVAFDLAMSRHECICPLKSLHLEHGERIKTIWSHLQECGILEKCKKISGRKAPLEYLRTCHDESYTSFFAVSPPACAKGGDLAKAPIQGFVQMPCGGVGVDVDTYFNDGPTQLSARVAVGCTVDLCLAVASGAVANGFAIVRPPGHNAQADQAAAFCYFNNVAIAAKVLQQKIPHLKKIAIIDWDIHHGKGLHSIFESDPNVLYISLHRYDCGQFYPFSGPVDAVGTKDGVGYTVNIAWQGEAMGDAEYLAAFRHVILPILDEFSPDFVIVAAGFDAAEGHPTLLGGYRLTPALFAHMTRALKSYANGRLVLVLEGGYEIPVVSHCVEQCLRALCDQDAQSLPEESLSRPPNSSGCQVLRRVLEVQQKYWPCLNASVDLSKSENEWEEQIDDI